MNFEVVLFVLLVVAGVFWICDRLYFRKFREEGEDRPAFLEYTAGFFPIILIVFIIRSFLGGLYLFLICIYKNTYHDISLQQFLNHLF